MSRRARPERSGTFWGLSLAQNNWGKEAGRWLETGYISTLKNEQEIGMSELGEELRLF